MKVLPKNKWLHITGNEKHTKVEVIDPLEPWVEQYDKEFGDDYKPGNLEHRGTMKHMAIRDFIRDVEQEARSQTRKECVEKIKGMEIWTHGHIAIGTPYAGCRACGREEALKDAVKAIQGEEE